MNIAMTTKDIAPITMPTLAPVDTPPGEVIGKAVGLAEDVDVGIEVEVGPGIVVAESIEEGTLVD